MLTKNPIAPTLSCELSRVVVFWGVARVGQTQCNSDLFKSVNIWQSYKQERGCLVHFLRLLAACWPGAQSA